MYTPVFIPDMCSTDLTWSRPLSLIFIVLSALFTIVLAIALDTAFYNRESFDLSDLWKRPVITPLNNFRYNSSTANLANHGLHPFYQHIAANLPQLIGPAFPLLLFARRKTMRLASGLSGIIILSIYPHQEARFLLPAVPLILSSLRLPKRGYRIWVGTWIIFNTILGILMGTYHQGGVVPAQMYLARTDADVSHVFWWKTYSPPIWLLNGKNENITTTDLMGMKAEKMMAKITESLPCDKSNFSNQAKFKGDTYLVAPRSAYYLRQYAGPDKPQHLEQYKDISLEEIWSYRKHLNLDDMDFGDDGIGPTLSRVVGDRGLVIWKVKRDCTPL